MCVRAGEGPGGRVGGTLCEARGPVARGPVAWHLELTMIGWLVNCWLVGDKIFDGLFHASAALPNVR